MAIFGRRRASSNPRPTTANTSSAATLAASQAFLANRASNANLSSAAATAALRTHTPTPTPVGQIQTKRMQRRGSVTSQASAPDGRSFRPGGLQRRDSGGSMTERSFRSPSPGTTQDPRERPASSHGPYPRHDHNDAPPVPALPKNITSPPQKSKALDRRHASLDPPQRISSPPPKQLIDPALIASRQAEFAAPKPAKSKTKKTSDSMGDQERIGSMSPVNFSRPMSPENALSKSSLSSGRVRSPTPTTLPSALPLANEDRKQDTISPQDIAPAVAKKKKKKTVAIEGLAEGNDTITKAQNGRNFPAASDATPQDAALSNTSTVSVPETESNVKLPPLKKKKKKTVQSSESNTGAEQFGAAYPSDTDSVTSERSSTTDRPRYYNTRAAGLLAKQPSIVREDREAEEEAEGGVQGSEPITSATSNGTATAGTPPKPTKPGLKGRQHGRSASQQVAGQASKLDVPGAVRHASLSPGRMAHFSIQPVNEGKKHQPPGRSVSPAKSALKSSPSRGHSPKVNRRGLAPSDASDSASQYSDDGSKSSMRKKGARVSFDEEPVIVGRAASPPPIAESLNMSSTQNKTAKTRTWIDLVRQQSQDDVGSDGQQESGIKPTPALPSFGSVRSRELQTKEGATEQLDQSDDRSRDTLQTTNASTDSAIGSVIAADASKRHSGQNQRSPDQVQSNDPLPPEVTSVEGSGYHSDDDDLFNEEDKSAKSISAQAPDASQLLGQPAPSAPVPNAVEQSGGPVPSIAVQPATPGPESAIGNRDSWLDMPGGFPSQKESEKKATETTDPVDSQTSVTVRATKSEPETIAATSNPSTPVVGEVGERSRTEVGAISEADSEDSTVGSIYSDAAEDQSDLEGDGYGSINAIVESPTSPDLGLGNGSLPASPLKDAKETHAQQGIARAAENEQSEPASSEGWDRAQAYWSGLSRTRKQQLEQAALPGAIDEPVIKNRSMRGTDALNKKKKKKKKVQPQPLGSSNVLPPILAASPTQKAVPRSTSPQTAFTPPLPLSMRDEPGKSALEGVDKRNSLNQQSLSKATLQKKARPTSAAATVDYSKNARPFSPITAKAPSITAPASSGAPIPIKQQKHFPAAKPKLQRDNSDSDSSFRKVRPKSGDGQRYTMRRSMRSQSSEPGSGRKGPMTGRATSPVETNVRRAFSQAGTSGGVGMRTSMRGPSNASKPTRTSLRTSMESGKANRTKSPSRFSFLGSSKAKPVATENAPTSGFSSRFADSSDEDDAPARANSRFADSSDDDGSAGLTPVRGIPRRTNEGDSTDLDDSDDEKSPTTTKAQSNVNGTSKAQSTLPSTPEGAALAVGSLRNPTGVQPSIPAMGTNLQAKKTAEKDKKKRSFFGSLSVRKHDSSPAPSKFEAESHTRNESVPNGTKADQLALESPKTSERVLGPSSVTADPVSMPKIQTNFQTGSQTSITQNSLKSPKLQRRVTPKRITSANDISWPLPQRPVDSVEAPARPKTSDGTAINTDTKPGPSLVLRHSVQAPTGSSSTPGATLAKPDPTKKKKKFSMLRKAFGL